VLALLALAGCEDDDPCDAFAGQSCFALRVDGPMRVDQLKISSRDLSLTDAPSPLQPRAEPVALPVRLAILPGPFVGSLHLTVKALLKGAVVGAADSLPIPIVANAHSKGAISLFGADAGVDAGPDLRGADLAGTSCDPRMKTSCPSGQNCIELNGAGTCVPAGTQAAGAACSTAPDDCVAGAQCFNGSQSSTPGLCLQLCAADGDCQQPPAPSGGMSEPNNKPHCTGTLADAPMLKTCTVPCNPVAAAGPSGCGALNCVYTSSAIIPEITFCQSAGTRGDGAECPNGNSDCAPGFSCVAGGVSFHCRAVCRAGHTGDCPGGDNCSPFADVTMPMFGICCPTTGC
jgi:hypothetical protein